MSMKPPTYCPHGMPAETREWCYECKLEKSEALLELTQEQNARLRAEVERLRAAVAELQTAENTDKAALIEQRDRLRERLRYALAAATLYWKKLTPEAREEADREWETIETHGLPQEDE